MRITERARPVSSDHIPRTTDHQDLTVPRRHRITGQRPRKHRIMFPVVPLPGTPTSADAHPAERIVRTSRAPTGLAVGSAPRRGATFEIPARGVSHRRALLALALLVAAIAAIALGLR